MPVPPPAQLGPLAGLVGDWEGDQGLDVSFHHSKGQVAETPYREVVSMKPFGPVDNGSQCLYGLDYRMSAWRADEVDPFHTEVGMLGATVEGGRDVAGPYAQTGEALGGRRQRGGKPLQPFHSKKLTSQCQSAAGGRLPRK